MTDIQEDKKQLERARESRTIVAFIVGVAVGFLLSADFIGGIIAGGIGAFIMWAIMTDKIKGLEEDFTIKGD